MPTENPRVNVTLSPSLNALVGRVATLQRISKAAVLRELLEASEDGLQHAAALMEAAAGARQSAMKRLADDMEGSLRAAERFEQEMRRRFAHSAKDLVADAEAVRGRRPRSSGAAAATRPPVGLKRRRNPPISNRGVK